MKFYRKIDREGEVRWLFLDKKDADETIKLLELYSNEYIETPIEEVPYDELCLMFIDLQQRAQDIHRMTERVFSFLHKKAQE